MFPRATLALFDQTLRIDQRKHGTHALRIIMTVLALPVLILAYENPLGAPGLLAFGYAVWLDLAFITLLALSAFASVITEEKEEHTLGLLRMTSLGSLTIVMGKSTSRMISAFILVALQLPFMVLAAAFGGVSTDQIVSCFVTLSTFLFLMTNLGLFASVVSRSTRKASGLVGSILFLMVAGFPILGGLAQELAQEGYLMPAGPVVAGLGWLNEEISLLLPIHRITEILSSGYSGSWFGATEVRELLTGGGLFLASWLLLARFADSHSESAPTRTRWFRRRRQSGSRELWKHRIFAWKDFHTAFGGRSAVFWRFVGYGAITLLAFAGLNGTREMAQMLAVTGYWFFLLELALIVGTVVRYEIKERTLSALYLLPTSMGSLLLGKFLGGTIRLIPVLTMIVLGACLNPAAVLDLLDMILREPVVVLFFASHLSCVALVGFLSLWLRYGAIPAALGIYAVGGTAIGMVTAIGGMNDEDEVAVLLLLAQVGFWVLIGIATPARIRQLAAA